MKAEQAKRSKMAALYWSRINLAVDFIENNLDRDFTLEEIAAVAGFSKYHFHRIFHIFTEETLFQFIQRLRLEKGATLLRDVSQRSKNSSRREVNRRYLCRCKTALSILESGIEE